MLVHLGRSVSRLWSPVEVRRAFAFPPEVVYAVLEDPETYPCWLVGAQYIRHVDPDFPAPGTAFHHAVGPDEDAVVKDSTESLGADPPHWLALEVRAGPLKGRVDYLVRAAPEGSEVRFLERPSGFQTLMTPILRLAIYARNSKSLEQLDAYLMAIDSGLPSETTRR